MLLSASTAGLTGLLVMSISIRLTPYTPQKTAKTKQCRRSQSNTARQAIYQPSHFFHHSTTSKQPIGLSLLAARPQHQEGLPDGVLGPGPERLLADDQMRIPAPWPRKAWGAGNLHLCAKASAHFGDLTLEKRDGTTPPEQNTTPYSTPRHYCGHYSSQPTVSPCF